MVRVITTRRCLIVDDYCEKEVELNNEEVVD
jgi:hypothetical protein